MVRKARVTIDWSLWDDQLGKVTDKEIADKIGSSVAAVSMRRNKLGIASSGERGSRLDWDKYDALLGTIEDKSLADEIGCSIGSIALRRKKLDIPAFNQRKSVDWEMWDEFIPDMSDTQLAKKIGCAPGSVKVRREKLGIKHYDGDLRRKVDWAKWGSKIGVVADKDLAVLIGCTVGAINAQRKKMNVGILSEKEMVRRSTAGVGDIWAKWDHMLGKCPDDALASLMGVTRSKVGVRRMRLVIANYPMTEDWPEDAKPCLGGCGMALSSGEPTCGKDFCYARWKEVS